MLSDGSKWYLEYPWSRNFPKENPYIGKSSRIKPLDNFWKMARFDAYLY